MRHTKGDNRPNDNNLGIMRTSNHCDTTTKRARCKTSAMLLLSPESSNTNTSTSATDESSATPLVVELYQSSESDDVSSSAVLAPDSTSLSQVLSYHNVSVLNSAMGLWTLALSSASDQVLTSTLMQDVIMDKVGTNSFPPCFVVDVDLSLDLSMICPMVRASMNMIVNGMKEKELEYNNNIDNLKDNYTSIAALEEHLFGDTGDSAVVKSNGGNQYISLVLAVQPSTKVRSSYQEEQALALIMYHLYRFSLCVNCVIAFVNKERPSETSNGESNTEGSTVENSASTMNVSLFQEVIHELSSGVSPHELSILKKNSIVEEEGTSSDSPTSSTLSLISPGTIDSTLVTNTMLKNANCEGQWDATTDSLDKALPVNKSMTDYVSETKTLGDVFDGYSDDEWLSKLASSMKVIEAPAAVKDDSKTKPVKKEAKKDVAVSSFFENLLKK